MATSMADLGFNIDSSPMRRATRDLDRMSGASGKAERSSRQLESATNAVRNAVTGLVAAISVREIVQYADTWQNVANQLRQVTTGTRELSAIQERLVGVSKDTRSGFEATATLYARLARSTTELGLSTEDLIDLTTTINQSFAVSGATAQEAGAAIIQLSQGLAAGALRGEEFNSVSEQAPALMRAIADSLGMTIGQLRAFAAEGNITAEIVVNALRKASDEIDTNFNKTIATFGQNIEVARTNLLQWVGSSSIVNNSVGALGDVVVDLSENIDTLIEIGGAVAAVFAARMAGGVATATGAMIAAQVQSARYQAALASMAGVSRVAATSQIALAGAVRGAGAAMAFLGGPVGVALLAAGSLYYFRDSLFATKTEATELQEEMDDLTESVNGFNRAQLESARSDLVVRLSEMKREATALAKELSDAEAKERMSNITSQGRTRAMGANTVAASALRREYQEMTGDIMSVEDSLAAIDAQMKRVGKSTETATSAASAYSSEVDKLKKALDGVRDSVDPLGAEFADVGKQIRVVQDALAFGLLDEGEASRIIKKLVEDLADAGEDASEAFENPWQDTADRVAQSLQDAIASGDWGQIGDVIGNTLATSISGIVSQTITDRLSKDLTSNSSTLAQIGGAFAGPIAGAVAGGAIQLATRELSDFFSLGDRDPTEDRQASQGTGTVLGSINAKSESIANSTDSISSTNSELVNINTGMLRALQSVQQGIAGASARIAGDNSQGRINMPAVDPGSEIFNDLTGGVIPLFDETFELAFDFFDKATDIFSFGLLDLGSLLGGSSRKVDEGIRILGGTLEDLTEETFAAAFATFRVKENAFSGTKTKEKWTGPLDEAIRDQFALVFGSIGESVTEGAEALGILPDNIQSRLDQFVVDTQRISLEGLNAAEQQAEFEAYFGTVFDELAGSVVPFLDEVQDAGEGLGETLARAATQLQVMEEVVLSLGMSSVDASAKVRTLAADALADLFGGSEGLSQALTGFESQFFSEVEQFETNSRRLAQALGDIPLPETRQGYVELIQAQDLSAAGDREKLATLLKLQKSADQYYDYLEDVAEDAAAAAKDAAAAAERAAERARKALMDLTDDALVDLQRSVEAQRARATESYEAERDAISQATDARLEANQLAIDAARAGLNAIQQEVQGLESALDSLRDAFDPMQAMRRAGALDLLRGALSSGDLTGTGEAAGIASQIDSAGFATRADFQREQGRTLNLLSALEDEGMQQLSTAEQSLESLQDQTRVIRMSGDAQLAALERGYSEEMQRLDGILSNAEQQVNALRGIDNSVMDLSSAIHALAARLGAEEIGPNEGGASASQIESLYASIGRDPSSVTGAEIDFWEQTGITGDALRQAFLEAAATYVNDPELRQYAMNARGQLGLPQFADGGIASGPTSGYMAELHGREAVIPLSGGAIPLKMMGGDKELLAEMRKMREELLAANRTLVKSNEKQRELLQRWDQNGLPEERAFV